MTVVKVDIEGASPTARKWALPEQGDLLRSPIPRGRVTYHGIQAIALKAAGDITSFRLNLTMPTGFVYIPRTVYIRFVSDDLVAAFDLLGNGVFKLGPTGSTNGDVGKIIFNMKSYGISQNYSGTAKANQLWVPPVGTPKVILAGGDTMEFVLTDDDSSESTAGDMTWGIEFLVFDVDQVDKWELNTPIQVMNQGYF